MPTIDPRYNNAGMAASLNNLVKAFSPPSAEDEQSAATTGYYNARAEGQRIQNKAQQSLGDAVAQLMNVNNQPAPPVPAAATPMAGMPTAAPAPTPVDRNTALTNFATSYLQSGSSPGSLGDVFLSLLANNTGTDRNTVVRALAGSGKPLGKDQAVDLGQQQDIRQQDQNWAIQKELATPKAVGPGEGLASAMGYYIKPDEKTYNDAHNQAGNKPVMVRPEDLNGIDSYISQRFGVQYDKNGNLAEGSNPDLSPQTRQMLTTTAANLMRDGRMDFQQATEAAIEHITGGKPLQVTGSDSKWYVPLDSDTRHQELTPEQARGAGGPQAAAPQAVPVQTATNPSTGERIISRDGGQTWSKM